MAESIRLPLFPLPMILYPETTLSVHVSEYPHRVLARRCLEEGRPFGVVWRRSESELAAVGCSARIMRLLREYPDGRLDILLRGERRFEILETFKRPLYLEAEVRFFDDIEIEPLDEPLRERAIALHIKLVETSGKKPDLSGYGRYRRVSFFLAANGDLSLEQGQSLLELRSENARLSALVEHLHRQVGTALLQRRVQSNGWLSKGRP
ncbi:MAG: LON peptidase substrate-binding domain-containing protein [Bacteroidetes bacterium]|nr:LON peptidase substrate-binding domain-containing protein [Rhodothermia bacterium]MCS7156066.1 LON peptidase substrate-binding domain-containing protein [Bacteroidota bacterium]MCX7907754.1 LON peptidase substrate-binding domain-containing protein [Bacteroidota bacterium]MDW8137883.1 LON peptidase substrate-binding domain-containing protein [Bacteroidota bacterium]MDW8286266.1 LON peptidase substrate-binding domain-containing protein [Bacteroidota bacterium]